MENHNAQLLRAQWDFGGLTSESELQSEKLTGHKLARDVGDAGEKTGGMQDADVLVVTDKRPRCLLGWWVGSPANETQCPGLQPYKPLLND